MSDPLFVVLVSGDPKGHDDTFARCAWLRVTELVGQFFRGAKKPGAAVPADAVIRFIHFDCHTASVLIYEHDLAKQKNRVSDPLASHVGRNWKTLDAAFQTEYGPLSEHEDPKEFVEWREISLAKASGVVLHPLSIVNVYHSIQKAPVGSVLELSIFSHAFVDGPVLFNTNAEPGSDRRSPLDTDGRAAIDFQPDMGETGNTNALTKFRQAFAPTGSFRIWGCNIQDIVETVPPNGTDTTPKERCLIRSTVCEVLNEAYTRPLKRGGALALLLRDDRHLPPGSTAILLDMDHEIAHEIELQVAHDTAHSLSTFSRARLFQIRYDESPPDHAYHEFFRGERDVAGDFSKTITRSLSDIVKFVAKETIRSYFFVAAQQLQTVTVVSGAPGTSAELPDGGQQSIPNAHLDAVKFFEKFYGASYIDPGLPADRQRHYSFLDNQGKAVKSILARAANGLP